MFKDLSVTLQDITPHKKTLYVACTMLFFWTLFEGTVSYVTPLKIYQAGFSDTMLGLIIGFSSIAGGAFDFLLSKFLVNTHFRRLYLFMFAVSFIYPFFLWQAKGIWLFLIAMSVWGLYLDLNTFATYDFVGRKFDHEEHSTNFGIIEVFKELAYMLAPLIAGLTLGVTSLIDWKPIVLMFGFLLIALSFFVLLRNASIKATREYIDETLYKPLNFLREFSLWKKVGLLLLPPLVITLLFNIYDSFFWTLGPLLAENFKELHPFNGLFLSIYSLPSLFVGWFVGSLTKRFGKKRTAIFSLLLGSIILSFFALFHVPFLILADVFFSSLFVGFASPAISGAYADYISESVHVEKEIEALSDFFINLGYVVGPILAGFLADILGNASTFSALGIMGIIISLILLIVTPKHITLHVPILQRNTM